MSFVKWHKTLFHNCTCDHLAGEKEISKHMIYIVGDVNVKLFNIFSNCSSENL
jgi:hypothetical protein